MTTIEIKPKKEKCHRPYKELATFKYDGKWTVWFSPFICLECNEKENFIEWKKVINNKGDEDMIYKCNCPKCEKRTKK